MVKVVATVQGTQYPSMSKYHFDPTCASYSGTTRRGEVTGTIWGTRVAVESPAYSGLSFAALMIGANVSAPRSPLRARPRAPSAPASWPILA